MADHKTPKISIGITSMTVILCVLCLTVFSVLTLSTALSEREFAEKRASAAKNYYAAESESIKIVNAMQKVLEDGGDIYGFAEQNGFSIQGDVFRFQKTIDDGQSLDVALRLSDQIEVEVWQVISTADWTPDDSLVVWDGSFDEE